jgi:hypothetical protein
MPSTNLKRTAATLGVLAAGLLAISGPAGAAGTQFRGELVGLEPTMKAPAGPTSEVFTSVSNVARLEFENTMISGYSVKAAAAGTQVGSEGVSDGRAPQGQYDKTSPR